jgi:hypothetical protein
MQDGKGVRVEGGGYEDTPTRKKLKTFRQRQCVLYIIMHKAKKHKAQSIKHKAE